MNIIEVLKSDYATFPQNQTFSVYREDVFFQDPVFKFRGRDRYQMMIGFIRTFFLNCKMDLHNIQQNDNTIRTDWTLSWNALLPWKPLITVTGWSELTIDSDGLIASHIDYWNCSRLDLLKQYFAFRAGK